MKVTTSILGLLSATVLAATACAQTKNVAQIGAAVNQSAVAFGAPGTAATAVTASVGLPVNCISGCGGSGGGGSGDASAANQTAVQATAGADASKVVAVQGVTGGKAVAVSGTFWPTTQPISASALPLPSGAATSALQTSGNTSLSTIASNTAGLATSANQLANVSWADQDAQALASSGTYSGSSRDSGVAVGVAGNRAYFNAFFVSSQSGTARIQGSANGSTWITVTSDADGALTAGTPLTLSVPVLFRYYRAVLANGATAATITVHSGFTGA